MLSRKVPIAMVVSLFLTTVLTGCLALSCGFYFLERSLQLSALRRRLEVTAEQISVGLAFPAWAFDYPQVDQILAGAAQDRTIEGIMFRPRDPAQASPVRMRALLRTPDGAMRATDAEPGAGGPFTVDREVRYRGETVGSLRLLGTGRFVQAELKRRAGMLFGGIAVLDAFLIFALYSLIWRTVIRPLRTIESFAVAVSTGERPDSWIQAGRFRGELRSLAAAIETMVALLQSRYAQVQASQSQLRLTRFALERMSESMFLIHADGRLADVNEAACQELGYTRETLLGLTIQDIDPLHSGDRWQSTWKELRLRGALSFESTHRRSDGGDVQVEIDTSFIDFEEQAYAFAFARDITPRQRAEEERAQLEAQLAQSRKLESIGRLAGGVAHDFNNMLSAIYGHTEMAELALAQRPDDLPMHLREISKAAKRSATLTQQLLAFARKQTIVPQVLDLNRTIEGVLGLLKRLIGEDIQVQWLPGPGLWPVLADPSQVDQILTNLCVNARDAIVNVGRITIETVNRTLDADYCASHPECAVGEYVRLTVSDDGSGMDRETLGQIFEPFFTTKELGRGTGLGLSTVYGIVRQNGGFINAYSEPGQGTSISLFLRRHAGAAAGAEAEAPQAAHRLGHETILLVEDEPAILEIAKLMLERQGYQVLRAGSPAAAVALAREHQGTIHLLVTDLIMPEMNGRELARTLLALRPQMKYLFMSGYTASVITHHGVLDNGVPFLQKPFTMGDLAGKIRELLDGAPGPG